jgi:hypothetical protein
MEYLRLSWGDIEEQCKELAKEIRKRNLDFDIIIALARGGWVPGRLLSDYLDSDELYTVRVKFYEGVGKRGDKPLILHPTQLTIAGKRVLLVDDIADTGESLLAAMKHLRERGARSIFVATLVKKPHSKITPDLYARETSAWVVFPWEVRETAKSLKDAGELERAGIPPEEFESLDFS